MTQLIIKPNMENYKSMTDAVGAILLTGSPVTVTIEVGEKKKRSLSVNGLQQAWIREVSEWSGNTEKYVRQHDKVEMGLPILREAGDKMADKINWMLKKIDYDLMSPKQKMEASEMFAVTSLMSSKQHREYRDKVKNFYADAGIVLVVR